MKQKLCFLFALLLIAIAGNAKTSKDVNGDGVTNVSDVTALVNQIIGSGNYSADACDVNGDGVVNVSDVTALVNFIINGDSGEEFTYETFNVNGVSFDMAEVEGGTFTMGATEEQGSDVSDNEKPAHQVMLSPYYIGKTEVTQELWEAVMGSNPSFFSGNKNRPVENVSWDDCQVFINKLNRLTGKRFRLPTEAEWEYAARGGKKSKGYKYSGSNTIDAVAWYDTNSAGTTHPVASKAPNELGLYDMSGNVWEWCSDWYGKSYYEESPEPNPIGPEIGTLRVKRGGDWYFSANKCRVSYRNSNSQHYQTSENGLRLVLDMPKETFSVNGVDFDMIEVEGGTFTMGATEEQGSDVSDNEKPAHQVMLSPYYIGKTEVTQELWEAVMGSNPSFFSGNKNRPVENVSWDDCQVFINKLNGLTGKSFRLPTEAEWEYAARGGKKSKGYKYSGSNTIDDVAWYDTNSAGTTHPVSSKAPNELGLYDMSGNVWEWCSDWYGKSYYEESPEPNPIGPEIGTLRVKRGGDWYFSANKCRVSYRNSNSQHYQTSENGLRLVLDMPKETFTVNGVSFNMVKVAGGTFTMGATEEQGNDALNDEKPAHEVTLSSYMIGETEVTQELWEAVMGKSLSQIASENGKETYGVGANYPMYYISWNDCQAFITKLNNLTGKNFRMPTEAEWEYAARGGNKSQGYKYSGSNTIDDVAWYDTNSAGTTHPVATKMPNELGLYDMSGSVWEWCSDWYSSTYYSSSSQNNPTGPASGSYRVFRGGDWNYKARYCRVSFRNYSSPTKRFNYLGLRLAL